jgi:D-3-phosphoglycerate dehydrogenase / 2-oxoglutarate reductase
MTILLLEPIHEEARALLEDFHRVAAFEEPEREAPPAEDIVAILTRGRGRVSRGLMEGCPELRVVARCGVGLDNVDLEAARERSIPVVYAPGSTTDTVAEHTLMLMLALSRRLCALSGAVADGRWEARAGYDGTELKGKKLGVVGLGAIGRRVAALAEAFGMHIRYSNRSAREVPYERLALEELLKESDVVSIHLRLTERTRHLLGGRELALTKPGALLINTSRGAVIDQCALAAALQEGRLGGFAADVLEEEPPDPSEELLKSERVLITPHVAALTEETYREMCVRTAKNVLAVLRGEQPERESVYNW